MKITAVIPARSGSKGIEHKNIRMFDGLPLLAHSVRHAIQSKHITEVIVSTDSQEYADIAKSYDAKVPFLRPEELSQDHSTDLELFEHLLGWFQENNEEVPEVLVHLRPTYPIRNVKDIDDMIEMILNKKDIDSIRSISASKDTPFKMWLKSDSGELNPVATPEGIEEAYNKPRQILPKAYIQNACIDVLRTSTVLEKKSMTGENIFGYEIDHFLDIDTEEDWRTAELFVKAEMLNGKKKQTFCFDIDGVIATITKKNDYSLAKPMNKNIKLINKLFEQGHEVLLFTARGSKTGIDWSEVTKNQMKEWGVNHHQLMFGKPAADFYIDDRFVSTDLLSQMLEEYL